MSKRLNATHYENIPSFPKGSKRKDRIVHAVMETVQGSSHKNALDNDLGIIALHQVLADGRTWPYDYGFIPQTLADDGDPLDILFLVDKPTFPGCLVQARVLGSVKLKKNGIENDRVIGAPVKMRGTVQSADAYDDIRDLPEAKIDAIQTFLVGYSEAEGNAIDVLGIVSAGDAMTSVRKYLRRFKQNR